EMRLNAYLQSWAPIRSALSVGKDLADMMKAGRKHGIDMDAMAVGREIQEEMPIWYHRKSYANRSVYNADVKVVKCLRENHKILTVRLGDTVVRGGKKDAPRHKPNNRCCCDTCRDVRETTGCKTPDKCFTRARRLLDALHEKWDPRKPQPEDYEEEQEPLGDPDSESAQFDPRITTHGTIADTFRIFTKGHVRNLRAKAPNTRHDPEPGAETISVYTDGSAIHNGKDNAQAGAGVFFGENDPRNRAIRLPTDVGCTNNSGEVLA
ncbi:hypothetical protein B0H12DRAFT_1003102, partial [Mycena haematopus]